ncbi:MAG: VanZ family protein [Planctomycetota bacterium]|nr:VanZ family protein [Planctomycetota bacterium]
MVLLGGVLLWVGASGGFPSSHWAVFGFYHDTLGLSEAASNQAAAVSRKAFHIPAYALLAVLAWFALARVPRRGLAALGVVLVVAITDETLQSFQPSRSGSAWDVLIDLVGGLLGVWIASRWSARRARGADPRPNP